MAILSYSDMSVFRYWLRSQNEISTQKTKTKKKNKKSRSTNNNNLYFLNSGEGSVKIALFFSFYLS